MEKQIQNEKMKKQIQNEKIKKQIQNEKMKKQIQRTLLGFYFIFILFDKKYYLIHKIIMH